MLTMLKQQSPRGFIVPRARPKTLLFLALAVISVYFLATRGAPAGYRVVPWDHQGAAPSSETVAEPPKSEEERKQEEERQKQEREKHEQDLRDEFAREYDAAKK